MSSVRNRAAQQELIRSKYFRTADERTRDNTTRSHILRGTIVSLRVDTATTTREMLCG